MAKLVTHLMLSIPFAPPSGAAGPLVRGYCRRLVRESSVVQRWSGPPTCKRCLERIATANTWSEAFRAEQLAPARAVMSEADRRHDAWQAVVARLGNHPLGFPMPKPSTLLPGKPARAITTNTNVRLASAGRPENTQEGPS
jgi:hypothetical protein